MRLGLFNMYHMQSWNLDCIMCVYIAIYSVYYIAILLQVLIQECVDDESVLVLIVHTVYMCTPV